MFPVLLSEVREFCIRVYRSYVNSCRTISSVLNYMDLYSRIQIEQVIADFSPAMLLVEHDVYFAEKLNAKAVRLKRRKP